MRPGSVVAVGLLLVGCTNSGDDTTAESSTTAPATTDAPSTTAAAAAQTTTAPTSSAPPSTTAPVELPSSFAMPTTPCEVPVDGPIFITVDCADPDLNEPFIDIDEQRTSTDPATGVTVSYRYIHGGFTDSPALFSFYFPSAEEYQGRFFHGTYPTVSEEDASEDAIAFGISNGAYVVSANNGGGVFASPALGGYRVNVAAAKFSRLVAAALYGDDAPVRGYLYGASGGAYQAIGGIENSSGVWDGAVPMVPGTPNAIPSHQGVMLLGLRVLGDQLPGIVDALEPGGSGDPSTGLSEEQAAILREVTIMGFPPRGWWQHESLTGGSFWAVAGGVKTVDPTYVDDFWNTPGYAGADPASSVRADRIQFDTTVAEVGDGSVTLAEVPTADLLGVDLIVTSGAAAGQSFPFVTVNGSEVDLGSEADPDVVSTIAPGDQVRLDNSWVLALQYYHRYQVPPADLGLYAWDQFRDASGAPIYPQRPALIGPTFAGISGGVATGRYEGKMIVLATVLDIEAFPWSADWYEQEVRAAAGDAFDDNFRLWFIDNADHTPPKDTEANAHIVTYGSALEQALLDLDAWVADGVNPPASTTYSVTDDSQIELPPDAQARGGVQPVVSLAVSATCDDSGSDVVAEVGAGEPVAFTVTAALPPETGEIVRVEWDFESSGEYPALTDLDQTSTDVELCETHTYDEPGAYFAVVRVTAQRDGDPDANFGLIENLARVRILVT